jgi:hypothetical protein
MDITPSTKELISKVQQLKSRFPDPVSPLFIDFYCQCKQGIDYLLIPLQDSVRLLDILNYFVDCVHEKKPTPLIELMWKDIVGPTLGEYMEDEAIERRLREAFEGGELKNQIQDWDIKRMSDGSVKLILRGLLAEITQIEREHKAQALH